MGRPIIDVSTDMAIFLCKLTLSINSNFLPVRLLIFLMLCLNCASTTGMLPTHFKRYENDDFSRCEQILTDGHLLKHKFECFDVCDELLGFRWELVPYRVKMQLHNLIKASGDRVSLPSSRLCPTANFTLKQYIGCIDIEIKRNFLFDRQQLTVNNL